MTERLTVTEFILRQASIVDFLMNLSIQEPEKCLSLADFLLEIIRYNLII